MKIFQILNLDHSGLEAVKYNYEKGEFNKAKAELVKYFSENIKKSKVISFGEEIRENASSNYVKDKEEILKVAEEVLKREFVFTLPWEMERFYKKVTFKGKIDWTLNPFQDEEWTFVLNRHRYLYLLAQGYLISEDKKYVSGFEEIICNWIKGNPLCKELKGTSWRTIESGIRLKNWVKALEIFLEAGVLDFDILWEILISINEHLEYLSSNDKPERVLSNWVILEQQGVFLAINSFPELKISEKIKESNLKTLEAAISLQVVEDGLHWEQSFQYHNEVLSTYLEILVLADRNNIDVGNIIRKKVYEMLKATLYTMKPNHCQSNYGDSDEEDLRGILTLGALIFKDNELKEYGYESVDLNSFMIYGKAAEGIYTSIQGKAVDNVSKAFIDSGLYFMRTGFGEEDSYTMFKCGYLGSGHGHSDTLHLEISYKGEDILVDSGRHTYNGNKPVRIELKKPKSHNTTIVDNEDFTVCTSSWSNNGVATPVKGLHKFTESFDFVEGGHLGYVNTRGVFANRKVVFIKPGIWILSDEFIAAGSHSYTQFYNFDSKRVEKIQDNKLKYNGKKVDFYIETLKESGRFEIQDSVRSKNYNQLEENKRAVFQLVGVGDTFINSVMYGEEKGGKNIESIGYVDIFDFTGKLINKDVAEAIEIKINENEKYMVLLTHKEDPKGRKLYIINNHRVYGRVAVISEKYGITDIQVLAY